MQNNWNARAELLSNRLIQFLSGAVREDLAQVAGQDFADMTNEDREKVIQIFAQRKQAPQLEAFPVAELIDTRFGTALIGASGMGKSTGLLQVFKKQVLTGSRPCLVVTLRDEKWKAIGHALQAKKNDFRIHDGQIVDIENTHSGVVFANSADPKTLPLEILQWAKNYVSSDPILIIDDAFVPGPAVDDFLGRLPLNVTLIWSTPSTNSLHEHIMLRTDRIIVMKTYSAGRKVAKLAFDLGCQEPYAFAEASNDLKPYQAIACCRS